MRAGSFFCAVCLRLSVLGNTFAPTVEAAGEREAPFGGGRQEGAQMAGSLFCAGDDKQPKRTTGAH